MSKVGLEELGTSLADGFRLAYLAGPLQQLDGAVDQHGCRPHPGWRVR